MAAILLILALQDEARLERIAERVDKAAEREGGDPERWRAEREALRAGPGVLKSLAARFPGRRSRQAPGCAHSMEDPGWHSEVVRVMIAFGEPAVSYLVPFLWDPNLQKRSMAAFALTRLPYESAVAPLIDAMAAGERGVAGIAHQALQNATFRNFATAAEYRAWHLRRPTGTRAEWLLDAVEQDEKDPILRRAVIESVPRLLPRRVGLAALITAYADRGWPDARSSLEHMTGIAMSHTESIFGDGAAEEAERGAWREFRKRNLREQELEIALHGGQGYFRKGEGLRLLMDRPAEALDVIERHLDRAPTCARHLCGLLSYVATAETYGRIVKLLDASLFDEKAAERVFGYAQNPDLAPRLLERLLACDLGPGEVFRWTFPRLCTPDLVPVILDRLPQTRDKVRESLLDALGESGDPRAWGVLHREVFSRPTWRAASMLSNFRGERTLVELHNILATGDAPGRARAARALADKGDPSGVPVLIRDLRGLPEDQNFHTLWMLEEIMGRTIPRGVDRATWAEEWWEENRGLAREEWLLESWRESKDPAVNPLLFLAMEEIQGIEADTQEERLEFILARVRVWMDRTRFRFDKDTVRVPYGSNR